MNNLSKTWESYKDPSGSDGILENLENGTGISSNLTETNLKL